MKKKFQLLTIALLFLSVFTASAQTTIVYEDNTGNNGKVEWTRTVEAHDAAIGVPKKFLIPIKNISKENLIIKEAKTHCGCTDAVAPKEPIAPGQTGYVEVTFTAKERTNRNSVGQEILVPPPFTFYQIIDVTTNFDAKQSVLLSVQGTVIK